MWKFYDQLRCEWTYIEGAEIERLIAKVTEAVIQYEFQRDTSGHAAWRRRRLRAWFMRGREDSYESERDAGLHRRNHGKPRVYALVGDEWVEAKWRLVEPTVELLLPSDSAPSEPVNGGDE